jgi:prepilin-type N-terminal cleavage/methylation domain-containing protein
MFRRAGSTRGFSLIELVVSLVVLAVVSSLAVPSLRQMLDRKRARSALNLAVAELYRARMHAVQSGRSHRLVLSSGGSGCVRSILQPGPSVFVEEGDLPTESPARATVMLDLPGLCLRHSGDSVLVFSSRGFLLPPARSLTVSYRGVGDSVVIAVSGRVRRSYRRQQKWRKLPHVATSAGRETGSRTRKSL